MFVKKPDTITRAHPLGLRPGAPFQGGCARTCALRFDSLRAALALQGFLRIVCLNIAVCVMKARGSRKGFPRLFVFVSNLASSRGQSNPPAYVGNFKVKASNAND